NKPKIVIMKKNLLLFMIAFIFSMIAKAQPDYKVVFDCTSKDTNDHKALVRWVNEIVKAEPSSQVEIVYFAQGLGMVSKGKSVVENEIANMLTHKNVALKVCKVAMKNQGIDESMLIPGVETV